MIQYDSKRLKKNQKDARPTFEDSRLMWNVCFQNFNLPEMILESLKLTILFFDTA